MIVPDSPRLVLAIDTSSPAVTAGVVTVAGGVVPAAGRAPLDARGHSELLAPAIREVLAAAGAQPRDVSAVVAGTGPGPYTGLRVGLVTAAAFAHAIDVPTYGVCSLDAIAAQAPDPGELLVATDARRREVYWARYDATGERVAGPDVARPADVPLDGITAIAGAGGELYADVWPQLARLPYRYPSPLALVALARERIESGAPGEQLTPRYLRRPDAVVPGRPKAVTR